MAGKNGTSTQITINSHADLTALNEKEIATRRAAVVNQRVDRLTGLNRLVTNLNADLSLRSEVLRFLMDGPRDIDSECGYPPWLTPDHFRVMYDREGIAKRVVECEPEETWAYDPELYEDEDPETDTPFEAGWKELQDRYNLWTMLQRADTLSGIGQFGIILLGLDDGANLEQPIEGIEADGTGMASQELKLLYLRVFSEEVVFVRQRETDVNNPRYSLPTLYTVQFRDFPNWGVQAGEIVSRQVHWTRVIHLADNRKMSEIYGIPRMQPVYNRLYDLRKIYAASGEGYWKGAFPGFSFEVNPEIADQGLEMDSESIREQFQKYQDGLQRYMAVQGVVTKTLAPQVVDPSPSAEAHLKAIAIAKGIPYRVLFGSEEARLASGEDARAWHKRMKKRQDKYVTPYVIRPFVDRLLQLRILPLPQEGGEYKVDWPDLNAPTDMDRANIAATRTQACSTYVNGGASQLIPPEVFLEDFLGMSHDQVSSIMEQLEEQMAEEQAQMEADAQAAEQAGDMGAGEDTGDDYPGDEDTPGPPPSTNKGALDREHEEEDDQEDKAAGQGSLTKGMRDTGNALDHGELSRRGVKKPVESPPVTLPSINKKKRKRKE